MLVLGIESSTMQGGVAIAGPGGLLAEYTLNIAATHSERLLPAMDQVLRDARLSLGEVEGYAIALGPGSFTGLRIGLGTLKGLVLAAERPVAGVGTLEALAWCFPFCRYPICPILDARKHELYAAVFRFEGGGLRRLRQDAAMPLPALVDLIREPTLFCGDGLDAYGRALAEALGPLAVFPPRGLAGSRPGAVAVLGRERLLRGEGDPLERLSPRYLRPAEAELRRAMGRR